MLSRVFLKIISTSLVALLLVLQSTAIRAEGENIAQGEQGFQSLVPSLFGLNLSEVQALLPQYDLTLGNVMEEESDGPEGTVLSQDKKPDTNVARFTAINISVAISRSVNGSVEEVVSTPPVVNETVTVTEVPLPVASTEVIEVAPLEVIAEKTSEQPKPEIVVTEPVEKKPETVKEKEEVVEIVTEAVQPEVIVEKAAKPVVEEVAEVVTETVQPEMTATDDSAKESREDESSSSPKVKQPAPNPYNGRKLTFTLDPEGLIQVTRKITMEMKISPPVDNNDMQYQFNISGKPYNSSSPVFTHVFDEEEVVILTASTRLPGKMWMHSESRRVKVGKYVPRKIKVPNIVGMNPQKAADLLKSKGLKVGNTRDKIVKGRSGILEQMPKAGTIRTEDDNEIHYVKAVDEKFQVKIVAKTEGLVTGETVNIFVKVSPKPRSSKTRYSFIVNGETHNSRSPKWQYVFKSADNVKVTAKAIINGEGTFESEPITLAISNAWKKPTAVISPYTLSTEVGETVTFESASTHDTRGELEFSWDDGAGNISTASEFSINTESMSEGEHSVMLQVKDEQGYENTATAQLIITTKATVEEESKEQIVEALAEEPTEELSPDVESEVGVKSAPDEVLSIVDAEGKTIPEVDDVAEIEAVAEIVKPAIDAQVMEGVVSNEQDKNASADVSPEMSTPTIVSSVSGDGINWGIWIWMLMIAIVLLPILWILGKLRGKPVAKKQAVVIPASPYGREKPERTQKAKVVSSSENRFANLDDKETLTPVLKPKKKKSANPDLVNFDLDVKPAAGQKSKKDELTDFNLDD